MNELTIEVQPREVGGKNVNRRLRAGGRIPAVVYGGGRDPVPIEVDRRRFEELMRQGGGENALFLLKLGETGKSRHTMIRDMQKDSITGTLVHIDFQRVLLDQKVRVSVPIELQGVPLGVKNEGGLLDFVTREVEIECLPGQIPGRLELDVSRLHVGQHLELKALVLPEGVTLHDEPDRVIVSLAGKPVHEEVEAVEGEEGLLGEAPAEPEVIRRGKTDEEAGD